VRWFFVSLPSSRLRTDSARAFLHSYPRRVRNFSISPSS
jgi:hypothetical protein